MAYEITIPEFTPGELHELAVLYAEEGDFHTLATIADECDQLEFSWMNRVGGWDETSLAYGSLAIACRDEVERKEKHG